VSSVPVLSSPAETVPEEPAPVIAQWTGREARALRLALRMTYIEFAAYLGVGERTVAYWHTRPWVVPVPELQRALDTVLDRAPADVRARLAHALTAGEAA
jgi:DNA-binding transcriptional regulator YiaG